MSIDQTPSGRERAIETLIDSEPNGVSYRANRVVEELLPHALSSRPNLITRAALVEQAHALAEFEIDSPEKYKEAFGLVEVEHSLDCGYSFSDAVVQRVLRHHEKIVAAKSQNATATPPPALVASLKGLFGSDLHQNVFNHKVLDKVSNDQINDGLLECIIGKVCADVPKGVKEDTVHALLLALLSILTGLDQESAEIEDLPKAHKSSRVVQPRQDPSDIPALQVGSIMSLLRSDVEKGPFSLDEKILKYLGEAASVFEEQIDVEKARLLAKKEQEVSVEQNITIQFAPFDGSDDENEANAVLMEDEGVTTHDDDDNAPDEIEEDPDNNEDNTGHGLPRPNVFDQIIAAVADGVDRAALRIAAGDLGADSSDSDSTNDIDSDHHLDRYSRVDDAPHIEPDDESSSSEEEEDESEPSPEIVDDDDDHNDGEEDDDDDDDDDGNNDSILRHALALSLSDHAGFAEAPGIEGPEEDDDDNQRILSPLRKSDESLRETSDASDIDRPVSTPLNALPDFPTAPLSYPYWSSVDAAPDADFKSDPADNLHPCLDPSSISRFGTIPSSLVIVRLLQNVLGAVAGKSCSDKKEKSKSNADVEVRPSTFPGGIGCSLFGSDALLSEEGLRSFEDEFSGITPSLQLLVATILFCFESRKAAIEGLRGAIFAEQRNAQGDDEDQFDDNDERGNDTPLSDDEEEDSNTVPLAMRLNYPAESRHAAASDRLSQAEALESKGMSRKAAAAGWDAAIRIKSLRKNTDAWKHRVKLFSFCTLLAIKSLRRFLQLCTCERLERMNQESTMTFSRSLSKVLPKSVLVKLDITFASLLSVSEFRSLSVLVSGEDEGEIEDLFFPFRLYREVSVIWGELTPVLASSVSHREQILRDLINDCFSKTSTLQHICSFDELTSFPTTEEESQLFKLDILCRRFCVTDLLNDVILEPLCFHTELDSASAGGNDLDLTRVSFSSSLVELLYFSSFKTSGACLRFLRRFSMAICHRYNLRGILWDGFYACSHFEADEMSLSMTSPSSSETLRVNMNPSPTLQLDSTKCSDSIAIIPGTGESPPSANGSSAHQRASKVWGTVVSSTFYNPKSGVHRWAVRLDRCERGHVFVGVTTAQASVRTYVGGDKYGWGVIGTQALWHDRRKIRGDYGSTFRTGSIIVVTLDTDAGTLGFSAYKDSNTSTGSLLLDQVSPSVTSPRRQAPSGGVLDDWGVAFEGLPLDAKLFPAIGLYQRDDMVTLLRMENVGRPSAPSTESGSGFEHVVGGMGYFPRPMDSLLSVPEEFTSEMTQIRKHNSALSWGSIEFVSSILGNVVETTHIVNPDERDLSWALSVLPSVAASISLLPPSIPVLSSRFALHILPILTECIKCLDGVIKDEQRLFYAGMREGKWVIRATASSGNGFPECEEYLVNLKNHLNKDRQIIGFSGEGFGTSGKSKNGLVSIMGSVYGSSIQFLEEWTDNVEEGQTFEGGESSCLVSARLALDGSKLEGTYRNLQYGATGHIAAFCLSHKDAQTSIDALSTKNNLLLSQGLLRLAHGHLALILANDASADLSPCPKNCEEVESNTRLRSFLGVVPFREGFFDIAGRITEEMFCSLRNLYNSPERSASVLASPVEIVGPKGVTVNDVPSLLADISKLDSKLNPQNGGKGSLSALCPEGYAAARLHVIASLVHHCCLNTLTTQGPLHKLNGVWSTALTIMESQVRASLSDCSKGFSMSERSALCCRRVLTVSQFLLSLQPSYDLPVDYEEISGTISSFIAAVRTEDDLKVFFDEFTASMSRAFLKNLSLNYIREVLPTTNSTLDIASFVAIESTIVAIPRLLGRGISKKKSWLTDQTKTGSHYLSSLSGAGLNLRNSVKSAACAIVSSLGQILNELCAIQSNADLDSLLLAIVPIFACAMEPNDMDSFVERSKILDSLSVISSSRMAALPTTRRESITLKDAELSFLIPEMNAIDKRDVSRVVMLTVVSVSHALTYRIGQWAQQASLGAATGGVVAAMGKCVQLFLNEFHNLIPFMEETIRQNLQQFLRMQGDSQYNSWVTLAMPEGSEIEKNKSKQTSVKSPLKSFALLLEKGTFAAIAATPATHVKSSGKSASTGKSTFLVGPSNERWISSGGVAFDQYLSRWLDILHCVVSSEKTVISLVNLRNWHDSLFTSIGLNIKRTPNDDICEVTLRPGDLRVAAHFRARILRLFWRALSLSKADDHLVKGLFTILGQTNEVPVGTLHGDESLVASEALACLRCLYSPDCLEWKKSIDRVIERNFSECDAAMSSDLFKVGVLVFLGGSVRALGLGSHVLLKPAAAAPFSPDVQSASNGKSSAGSSSASPSGVTSHHVVGTGTEGIVSGLCRSEAAAGVVSSVDAKTGMCEVILVDRYYARNQGINVANSKGALTVRALRSPLSDVAIAELYPLLLEANSPVILALLTTLPTSIAFLASLVEDTPGNSAFSQENIKRMHMSILSLRAAIVLLSDERVLEDLKVHKKSRATLSELLYLAGNDKTFPLKRCEAARVESLATLPFREGKYAHFLLMLAEIQVRRSILETTVEELWSRRANQDNSQRENTKSEEGKDSVSPEVPQNLTPLLAATELTSSILEDSVENISNRGELSSSRPVTSQSSVSSNSTEDDEESDAAATAASHLREAAIAQMLELGLPRSWSELALRRTGGANIEAAVHFCLERGGDMERLLAEERERERLMQRSSTSVSRRRSSRSERPSHLLRQLLEMGFPSRWCAEALAATQNNVDEALTWILSNGVRLSEEDEGMDEEDEGEVDEDDEDDEEEEDNLQPDEVVASAQSEVERHGEVGHDVDEPQGDQPSIELSPVNSKDPSSSSVPEQRGWRGSVTPLRFISGQSIIDPSNLSISGLPNGGFSSVGTKGVLLTSGKWYYEAILETAGCLQIGWADGSFSGHCHAERGDGCGDGPSSWAFDGWRRYRWHSSATEWGCRWKEGDVVGCLVDMDEKIVSFTLNGKGEEVGMGVAFSGNGFRPCGGVYACVSFNRKEKLRLILGGKGTEPFVYDPPDGFVGVGEAVLSAVQERETLVSKEVMLGDEIADLNDHDDHETGKRFLCDFSDGEHGHELFAWQHRYYGSDASVHLGSGRHSKSTGTGKNVGAAGSFLDCSPVGYVSLCLEKKWSASKNRNENVGFTKAKILESIELVSNNITQNALQEGYLVCILFSRKLLLHLVISMGSNFDLAFFDGLGEVEAARRFWRIIDASVSLRSAGWVGEAGAMAIAAEALGLGISSTEHSKSQLSDRSGLSSVECGDVSMLIPVAGISQLLNTIMLRDRKDDKSIKETWQSVAACAEASIGADGGGGPLVFLQRGLQSAVCKSDSLRAVLVAFIRRSVRQLGVIDFSGDESLTPGNADDDDPEKSKSLSKLSREISEGGALKTQQPDARLTCFLTGLLLSRPVQSSCASHVCRLFEELLEAWSVGLLSASAPWRMVCCLTAAGILNLCPEALPYVMQSGKTVSSFYHRLHDRVLRRMWAERAAVPVCSRYVQSLIELVSSIRRADPTTSNLKLCNLKVDAATPIPMDPSPQAKGSYSSWEWDEGWVANDAGWETWVGSVECCLADWKAPSRSAIRPLMDGGEGPPMLREGCVVMRGPDWEQMATELSSEADGKKEYEAEKAEREKEKRALEEQAGDDPAESELESGDLSTDELSNRELNKETVDEGPTNTQSTKAKDKSDSSKKKKRKKISNPKLPVGTVLSVEPWDGVPAMARRVRWHLTGEEGIYRFGGGGGRFDICHVEVNEKGTRVRRRHPLPESAEQCAARHGFGSTKKFSVLLRLRKVGKSRRAEDDEVEWDHEGVLEWPDFGAGVRVSCVLYDDGAVLLKETELLFGSKDSGWEARFGQASFIPGTEIMLSPAGESSRKDMTEVDVKSSFLSVYQQLLGSTSFVVNGLRNRSDGAKIRVTLEMTLLRGRRPDRSIFLPIGLEYAGRPPPPLCFDRDYHASSMSLSRDGRTLTCVSPDGRGTAFASIGFTKGVHYWEVKLEQAETGSVFIGVAEKPNSSPSSGGNFYDESTPRLNRWLGWGFVNFRATYTAGAERVYGAHCHNEDTVGVLLDCDAGRISFFYDGMKFGEHILNDLGCAFENLSPFGFNADGCGSGGIGQGAPSAVDGGRGGRYPAHGIVRPRSLWPVIGLRNPGDRVTLSTKWSTSGGIDGSTVLKNILAVDELIEAYTRSDVCNPTISSKFPDWFIREAFDEYRRWHSCRWYATTTRASGPYRLASFGLDVELDCSALACATASAAIGLRQALLPGDRVVVKRSVGRPLELAEEAVVLGAHQCRLYYRLVSQKSEGGSLTTGGGRAWFWDESEVVGDSLQIVGEARGRGVELPLIDRFRCMAPGGIKVVYEGGAVVRSDLEIIDRSTNLGTIPRSTVISPEDVLERRVNSCGVIRYRIRYEGVEGWISSRIRGGKEESIIVALHNSSREETNSDYCYKTPEEAALAWNEKFKSLPHPMNDGVELLQEKFKISTLDQFSHLVRDGVITGISVVDSDSIVTKLTSAIADFSADGDAVGCSFADVAEAVSFAFASSRGLSVSSVSSTPNGPNLAATTILSSAKGQFPSAESLMARVAVIRALNRRVQKSIPWLPTRPSQEGTAILGGLCGQGASVDRAGRTKSIDSLSPWIQVPSIASRIRSMKSIIFSSVKNEYLESVIMATSTPTPLSPDEYELPREIRTVRINRLKARRVMEGSDSRLKRKHSVFAQLQNETRTWGGAALRRGFVAKGHGGQKRAFKVKLIGEGVNDYSGPYREVFTDAVNEVLDFDDNGKGTLGVLDPTPNNITQIGDDRDLMMFARREHSPLDRFDVNDCLSQEEVRIRKLFASLTTPRDESSREVEDSLMFLGRLVGTAARHGIPVDLRLPMTTVWNAIVEDNSPVIECLNEIDLLASKQSVAGEGGFLLSWEQRMLNSFVDGLSHVLPTELLPLLSGAELCAFLCGNPEVDVDLLKRVVEYEGYAESDIVISYFWETLREMSNNERKKFLQFVWARNRLPNKESDFEAPFKILKDSGGNDATLPSASTCFFSLTLPAYSTKEILRDKLSFAIENVCTMESDYVTNDAEVGEGWRGV